MGWWSNTRSKQKLFQKGWTAGYTDYRHGPRRPISLAPVFKKTERVIMVDSILDTMREWRFSPFENEGAVRAGLRSSLCLAGHQWASADAEAASLVTEALRYLGGERPSWIEGQREYSASPDFCSWCQAPLEDDLRNLGGTRKFCTEECARSAIVQRSLTRVRFESTAYSEAANMIQRLRLRPKDCAECKKPFRPRSIEAIYCTRECLHQSKRIAPLLTCETCSTGFRSSNIRKLNGGRFCSSACYIAKRSERRVECCCHECGILFTANSPTAKFCSGRCKSAKANLVRKLRAVPAHDNVTYLTAEIFDGWFQRAA